MYHWYLLIKSQLADSNILKRGNQLTLRNETEDDLIGVEPDKKLFWIGFIEVLPLIIGVLLTDYFKSLIFSYDYVVMGLMASIIIAYIIRKDIPDQPISIQTSENETARQL